MIFPFNALRTRLRTPSAYPTDGLQRKDSGHSCGSDPQGIGSPRLHQSADDW